MYGLESKQSRETWENALVGMLGWLPEVLHQQLRNWPSKGLDRTRADVLPYNGRRHRLIRSFE